MKQRLGALIRSLTHIPMGVWIVILVVPVLTPLLRGTFFESHDGVFHVYRLMALDQAVRSGVLYPRWFPEFAFGYGQPVLNFYGPLSYYWGLPFTLAGADAALGMKLVLATGLIASALGLYLFARLHLERGPSLVAAVLYAYLPYHLIDLYVRGAVAEFLSFVWFPLILWAFHRLILGKERGRLIKLALASLFFVALIVTHSLSALIFAPMLAGYLLLLLWQRRSWRILGNVVLALALTLVLSAFYWVPILVESGYVGLGHGVSQGYQDHLLVFGDLFAWDLTYDYAIDIPITFQLGWGQVVILVASLVLFVVSRRLRLLSSFLLLVALISIFMLTTTSLLAWQLFEDSLAFLQYPWRFQALTVFATALLAGTILQATTTPSSRGRLVLGVAMLLVTGVWALWSLPVAPAFPDLTVEGMWRKDRDLNQIGATWTGEYVPIWVKEQRWAISHPAPDPSLTGNPESVRGTGLKGSKLLLTGVGYTRFDLTMDAPEGVSLALHQFYFPGWQARWQGKTIPAEAEGDLGLASFDLPPGSGPLTLRLALTPAQLWGTLASLAAALTIGVALFAHCWQLGRGAHDDATLQSERNLCVVVSISCLLPAAVLLAGVLWPNGSMQATNSVNANLEDIVELQAFSATSARYRPGDTVEVTLYWMALDVLGQDYKTFIHLTDAEVTRQPTQHDDDPGGNFTPTTRWMPGELVPDTHYLTLPADLPPGRYNLWADMYEYPGVRNLAVLSADVPTDGKRVLLTEILVAAP